MARRLIKILLIVIIACTIYYGSDYVSFWMIGFPYAAGSYPFAKGYGFNCDYNVLKKKIIDLRSREGYKLPTIDYRTERMGFLNTSTFTTHLAS